jgi:hypothetical protein
MMKKVFLCICILFLTLSVLSKSESEWNRIIVTFKLGDEDSVRAEITVNKTVSENPFKYTFAWGCATEMTPPISLITDLELFRNDKKIPVPLSAFSDLTHFEKAWIEKDNHESFVLVIRGGETSTGYTAKIHFDSFVRKRVVRSRTFPDTAWDETVYHINELNN